MAKIAADSRQMLRELLQRMAESDTHTARHSVANALFDLTRLELNEGRLTFEECCAVMAEIDRLLQAGPAAPRSARHGNQECAA